MPVARLIIATLATLLSISANVVAEDCLHKDGESADQRARREAAIRYLLAINTAQARVQADRGTYAALSELPGFASVPVGFVPRLLFDRWYYVIKLSDFFDPCGFTLFLDEHGVIYESHPRSVSPDMPKEVARNK
jgi:hypothetical protein